MCVRVYEKSRHTLENDKICSIVRMNAVCGVRQIVWYEFGIESMFDARAQKTTNDILHLFFTMHTYYKWIFEWVGESSASVCVWCASVSVYPLCVKICPVVPLFFKWLRKNLPARVIALFWSGGWMWDNKAQQLNWEWKFIFAAVAWENDGSWNWSEPCENFI